MPDNLWTGICETYRKAIVDNYAVIKELENLLKLFSYAIAGRFKQSAVWAELASVTSNLIKFTQVEILNCAKKAPATGDEKCSSLRLKQWIRIIEHIQVFLELSTSYIGGKEIKWLMILFIETIKIALKVILLMKYKERFYSTSSDASSTETVANSKIPNEAKLHEQNEPLVLKRSGRILKSLSSSGLKLPKQFIPSTSFQNGKHNEDTHEAYELSDFDKRLSYLEVQGELVHIMRPLVHLSSMYIFGVLSWKPYLISIITDIVSYKIFSSKKSNNKNDAAELYSRKLSFLLYILRSPFFDVITKKKVLGLLETLSRNIPLAGFVLRPLVEYLPEWQKIYFYTWS